MVFCVSMQDSLLAQPKKMNELLRPFFTYEIQTFSPTGEKEEDFTAHNLICDEGLRLIIARLFSYMDGYNTLGETAYIRYLKQENSDYSRNAISFRDMAYSRGSFYVTLNTNKDHIPSKNDNGFDIPAQIKEKELNSFVRRVNENLERTESNKRKPFFFKEYDDTTYTATLKPAMVAWGENYGFSPCAYIVDKKIKIYGLCCLFVTTDMNFGSQDSNTVMMSEVSFDKPIILHKNGTINITPRFTIIPGETK